jgi:hypothetical protein
LSGFDDVKTLIGTYEHWSDVSHSDYKSANGIARHIAIDDKVLALGGRLVGTSFGLLGWLEVAAKVVENELGNFKAACFAMAANKLVE